MTSSSSRSISFQSCYRWCFHHSWKTFARPFFHADENVSCQYNRSLSLDWDDLDLSSARWSILFWQSRRLFLLKYIWMNDDTWETTKEIVKKKRKIRWLREKQSWRNCSDKVRKYWNPCVLDHPPCVLYPFSQFRLRSLLSSWIIETRELFTWMVINLKIVQASITCSTSLIKAVSHLDALSVISSLPLDQFLSEYFYSVVINKAHNVVEL